MLLAIPSAMQWRVVVAVVVALLGAVSALTQAGASGGPALQARTVVPASTRERAILIFVDSLSDQVALDEQVMPELASLRRRGAAFHVEPCRDRLTHLCLRAAFTGRDESSLWSLHQNFDHERLSASDTVLHELAAAGGPIVAVGASDLLPYRKAFTATRILPRTEETPEKVVATWSDLEARVRPQLAIVGLGSGDLAAHVHGTGRPEYRTAFRTIDRIIGEIARRRDPDTHVIVLGDHGHDSAGRHLPGGPSTTFALYSGRAFRAGFTSRLAITDHSTLLGTLLGVSIPGTYAGPALREVFEPSWASAKRGGHLPDPPRPASAQSSTSHRLALGLVLLLGAASLWLGLSAFWQRRAATAASAAVLVLVALASGYYYDQIRWALHDHGFTPERSLYLLVPLALGFGIALGMRRYGLLPRWSGSFLPAGAAASLVFVFLLLFPNAYYYGSSRAVTYAALVGVGAWVLSSPWRSRPRPSAALPVLLAVAFISLTLVSFCSVGQTDLAAPSSSFVLKSRLYRGDAWVPFVLGKAVVFALLLIDGRARRSLDSAAAASLLTASAFVQLADASVGRWVYAGVGVLVVVSFSFRRFAPMAHLCAGMFVLNHFYGADPVHLAPIELLIAATSAALFAFRRTAMGAESLAVADSLTLVTAAYLLLWPLFGFRLAGIDFRFMFEWVPPARYEELWWVIAGGTLVKLGVPYLLLAQVAEEYRPSIAVRSAVAALLAGKVALLSVTLAAYAIDHSMQSNLATDMLSELALVSMALVCLLPFLWVRRMGSDHRTSSPGPQPESLEAPRALAWAALGDPRRVQ